MLPSVLNGWACLYLSILLQFKNGKQFVLACFNTFVQMVPAVSCSFFNKLLTIPPFPEGFCVKFMK